jgi:hypothetical protein
MMCEDFWQLVQKAHTPSPSGATPIGVLTAALAGRDQGEIANFAARLRREADLLDRQSIRAVADQLWLLDGESWLHMRAWCVGEGADFVAQLKRTPSLLRVVAESFPAPFEPPTGELLLYCADYARVAQAVH